MNTGPANDPSNSRNRSRPWLEIALIRFTPNRLPVRLITGVWPTGAHDRPAGPQKPRQAELVGRAVPHQRNDLSLLACGKRGLLAGAATAAPLGKPRPAALAVALDPAVHRVGVHPEHPRGLGLGHAVQDGLDGPVAQRRLGCTWQGSSVIVRHAPNLPHHNTICLPR